MIASRTFRLPTARFHLCFRFGLDFRAWIIGFGWEPGEPVKAPGAVTVHLLCGVLVAWRLPRDAEREKVLAQAVTAAERLR